MLSFLDKRNAIYEKLPFMCYPDPYTVVNSDGSRTVFYEVSLKNAEAVPAEVLEVEAKRLDAFFREFGFTNAIVQWVTVNLPFSEKDEIFKKNAEYGKDNPLMSFLLAKRRESLMGSFKQRCCVAITVFLDKSGNFDAQIRELKRLETVFCEEIVENLQYEVRKLPISEVFELAASVINPGGDFIPGFHVENCLLDFRKRLFLSDFEVKGRFLYNGSHYFACMVMDVLPKSFPPSFSSSLLQKVKFPFLMNITLFHQDQNTVVKELEWEKRKAMLFSGKKSAAGIQNDEKKKAIELFLQQRAREQFKILKCFISFLVWDKDEMALNEKIAHLRSAVSSAADGAGIFLEWLRLEDAFVASLPGAAVKSYDHMYISSQEAARALCLRAQFRGDEKWPLILYGNRQNGITAFNPFSPAQNKWAGFVIGPSGSGKSFFLNHLVLYSSLLKPFIAIFDMATYPSFEVLTQVLGGSFLPVTLDEGLRINLFDLRLGENFPRGSKLVSLLGMLTSMLLEEGQTALPKEFQGVLHRAVDRLYKKFSEETPKRIKEVSVPEEIADAIFSGAPKYQTFREYRDYYISKFVETEDRTYWLKAEMAQNMGTPTLSDFVRVISTDQSLLSSSRDREICEKIRRLLSPYTEGAFSVLFNGVTNLVLDEDVFCFHLGEFREQTDILALLVMLLRDFCFRKAVWFKNEIPSFLESKLHIVNAYMQRPKLFLYDEFHNIVKNQVIMDLLDKDSRQQRTLGMATYLATQEIKDIPADKAFVSSSANKIFTRLFSPESSSVDLFNDVKTKMGLNEAECEILASLKFEAGQYAEVCFFREDVGKGVVRFAPTPYERWILTSHRDERFVRDNLVKELVKRGVETRRAYVKVVNFLARKYPDGLIGRQVSLPDLVERILVF